MSNFRLGIVSCCLLAALWATPGRAAPAPAPWVISFLDIGQGDSTLLQMPDGQNVLIDAGDRDRGDDVLAALRKRGVKALDMVIMTHPHADHIGGVGAVLKALPVRLVLDAGVAHGSRTYERVLDTIAERGFALKLGRPGLAKQYGPVSLEVLAPAEPLPKGTRSDVNNASIITRWRYGDISLLATGDAESEALDLLMKREQDLRATVLKVPHHGSRYTMNAAFLARVKPQVAVISAGRNNDYGHPHKQALARLRAVGARIFVTADVGTVTLTTTGKTLTTRTDIEQQERP